jgi:hypothetical protein
MDVNKAPWLKAEPVAIMVREMCLLSDHRDHALAEMQSSAYNIDSEGVL